MKLKIVFYLLTFVFIISSSSQSQNKNLHEKKNNRIILQNSLNQNVKYSRNNNYTTKILTSRETDLFKTTSNSTIIFEESFEGTSGFPPAGWISVNNDGGGTTGPWFQGNTSVFPAYHGYGYAAANYEGANDFYIDEWLITPRIYSVSQTDTLIFWNRSPDYTIWDDSLEIRISKTDTSLASFTIRVDYFKTSTNGWAQKKYPLKNFVNNGDSIYIAFRYLIYDGGISGLNSDYVGIDFVQIIRPQLAIDIRTFSVDYPINGGKILVQNSFTPTATFQNIGTTSLTNIPVRYTIYPPSGSLYESNKNIPSLNPNQSIQVTFDNYYPATSGTYNATVYSLLPGDQNRNNDSLRINFLGAYPLSGNFTVGIGGEIATIKNAVDTLVNNLIAGDITFSLINSTYFEPPLSIKKLDYISTINPIIIKPAPGISSTINVSSTEEEPFGFALFGASNIILDGSNSGNSQKNLTINLTGPNGKIGVFISGIPGANADSNIIKNIYIRTAADSLIAAGGFYGILISGYSPIYKDAGNKIINCDITKHGSIGMVARWQNGLILENNFIHDWRQINGETDLYGILLEDGIINSIIRCNIIGNIQNLVNYNWACGIENAAGFGSNNLFYNNMIYGILASGSGEEINISRGISSSSNLNSNDGYYYNSIYLSGTDNSTSTYSRVTGFEFLGGTNITLKNNIVFNEATISGNSINNKAYCIYLTLSPQNFISNNNDLYAPGLQGVTGYNSGNRITLTDWRNSFSPQQDNLSISSDPLFVSKNSGNLHIHTGGSSPVNNAGVQISDIFYDVDGDLRSSITPDIGADEFNPAEFSINVNYNSGWNLVAVPIIVSDSSKDFLFLTSISSAFSYNNGYIAQSFLQRGKGYWLKFATQTNNIFGGSSMPSVDVQLTTGWNLVGSVDRTISAPSDYIIQSNIYGYYNGYFIADSIHPGQGYWLKARTNGTLTLGNQKQPKINTNILKLLEDLNNLTLSDGSGLTQKLFFGAQSEILNNAEFELPPPPPIGILDIRFSSQKFVELYNLATESAEYQIQISTKSFPLKIKSRIITKGVHKYHLIYQTDNNINKIELNDNKEIVIEDSSVTNLILHVLKENLHPKAFLLEQNYPNPFNSETNFKFQLPVDCHITIKIFNTIGQEIKTLINSEMNAGYHQFDWKIDKSSEIGSGIYFYRISAFSRNENRNFIDTKKFLLLK